MRCDLVHLSYNAVTVGKIGRRTRGRRIVRGREGGGRGIGRRRRRRGRRGRNGI
jgi:hypothetical protein